MAPMVLLAALALAQAEAQSQPPPPPEPPVETAPAEGQTAPAEPPAVVQDVAQNPAPVPVQSAPADLPQPYAQTAIADQRIRLLPYHADQIVNLAVSPGFASVVELGEDERIENVVVGNSATWQVTANKRGDRVIVKPLSGASQSNMIVLTGSRRYVFVLDPFGESSFIMRFTYPQAAAAAAAVQLAPVAGGVTPTYRFRGNKGLFPQAMSDDGRRTVIRWGEQSILPAIFAMNGRREQLVNGRMVGNDYVIEGAAPRYKFRYGKAEATATRTLPKRRR